MIWLAWRRQRPTVLSVLGLGLVAVIGMLAIRFAALSYMDDHGIAGCTTAGPGCDFTTMNTFADAFMGFQTPMILLMFALPPLVGAFTGGPLFAREIERGTHIFALTQSVGRTRWWSAKILVGVVPVFAATLAIGLFATWAMEPLSYLTSSPIRTPGFETQGVLVAAYTVLAFAIGSTAGLLLRNTLAAMVVTIVLYIALLVTAGSVVREHYAAPITATETIADEPVRDAHFDAWQIDYAYLDAQGGEVEFHVTPDCGEPEECMASQGITQVRWTYHPASRFWRFQFTEAAVFLGVAVALVAASGWAVRRVRS